jgi:PPOX class probable F420-dependent enzyme
VPRAPLPPELEQFVRGVRPAVVGTVRPDGAPVTSATWYDWEDGRILLSMDNEQLRMRNIRHEPRISLTILGDNWYDHVSIRGTVVEIRDDSDLVVVDRLSHRYRNKPYSYREFKAVAAVVEITHWHTWGKPGKVAEAS